MNPRYQETKLPFSGGNHGEKDLLLVEDEGVARRLLTHVLEREYEILEARGYQEAIQHLRDP